MILLKIKILIKILFIKKRSNHFSNPKEIKKIKYPPNVKNAKTPYSSYAKVGRYQKKKFK